MNLAPDADVPIRCGSLRAAGWRTARTVLRDPNYYKFTFVRHPFPRLVSAYANKFLNVRSPAWPTIRAIQATEDGACDGLVQRCLRHWSAARRRDLTDSEARRSVTFRQFIEYVATQAAHSLDVHWRPQYLFCAAQSFDWIGRFERLVADFAVVQRALGLAAPLSAANRSAYEAASADGECVADWPASQLRASATLPPRKSPVRRSRRATCGAALLGAATT